MPRASRWRPGQRPERQGDARPEAGRPSMTGSRRTSQECWDLGDRALAEAPMGRPGLNTGVFQALKELAARERVPVRSLVQYRGVAEDWPPETRRRDVAWSVHDVLRYEDDRFELIWTEVARNSIAAKEYVTSRPSRRRTQTCRICGGRHRARGLCEPCYFKARYRARKKAGS